jgi:hypothetical protein
MPPISPDEFEEKFHSCQVSTSRKPLGLFWPQGTKSKDPEPGPKLAIPAQIDRLALLPQKLTTLNEAEEASEFLWDLLARECISFAMILTWNIVCMLPGLIFCFLWLFKLGGVTDLQTASVPMTMVFAALTIFWTLYIASLYSHSVPS